MKKPRLVVLNGSCLDTIEDHREWAEKQNIEFIAESGNRVRDIEEIIAALEGAQAAVGPFGGNLPARFFERVPTLRTLALASSGYDFVEDPAAATRAGVVISYAPVPEGAEVVADFAWGLLLAIVRRIPEHVQKLQQGNHERGMAPTVYGKTLGILGLGNIGKAVARRAAGFAIQVIACETRPDLEFVERNRVELVDLDELLRRSDFLSIHLRLNEETRGVIGERELSLMKPGAYLINTARDALVNESALLNALDRGVLAGAATDEIPRNEKERLLRHPKYLCTPHLGNRAVEGVFAVTRCALQSAVDVLQGRRPPYVLNPEVYERGLRNSPGSEVAAR
jgi:phosphoglycerate dehydrogenase-like enzyme